MNPAPLLAAVGAAGVAMASYATLVEPRLFTLRSVTAALLRPPAIAPLRVLHLSDLHLQGSNPPLRAFLQRCAAEEPDIVVVTGDILGRPEAVRPAVDLLAELRGERVGLFVLGSNDRFAPIPKNPLRYFRRGREIVPKGEALDTGALLTGLSEAGWIQLDNRRVRVETPAGPVDAIGLGDAHIRADRPSAVEWTPPGEGVTLGLGVTHAPYRHALERMDGAGLDLALAGHTHGGQVRVPGVGALVANCDLPLRQARGLTQYGAGLALHVSAGLGASRYAPFRFACRPEATILDLVARSPEAAAL